MTAVAAPSARGDVALSRALLLTGVVLASLTEAIASTLLSSYRLPKIGSR